MYLFLSFFEKPAYLSEQMQNKTNSKNRHPVFSIIKKTTESQWRRQNDNWGGGIFIYVRSA